MLRPEYFEYHPIKVLIIIEHCWSRGMILAFQADEPGSSPGQCIFLNNNESHF